MNKLVLILIIIFNSCSVSKEIEQTGIQQIEFGSGGGFTGEVILYTLNKKGQILENGRSIISEIDRKETLELFQRASSLMDYTYHKPQNMYYFLEIKSEDISNRIVWGEESRIIRQEAKDLHQKLMSTINKGK